MNEINYKKVGSGEIAVIVMHEWMGDHTNYNQTMPYLNTKDFSWIFVDFRGYGLSKNIKGKYTLEEACEDVICLIEKLNIKQVHLVGHSMSSFIAQKLALILQDRVKTLILVTPISPNGIKMKEEAKQKLLENVKNKNGVIEQVVQSASKRYNDVWREKRVDLAHNCSLIEAKLGYMQMYLDNDFSKEIKGLKTSIYIIFGKYDLLAFHKNTLQKEFLKYYPNCEIIQCQEAGHYPMIECPVFFANLVEKFISLK